MDDLEVNPLYQALLTKFRKELDIACNLSCLIAIPRSDSLENLRINQFLVNSHVLMPSKLLKMHFTPLQVGCCDDIEIEDERLIVSLEQKRDFRRRIIVNILGQDIGYSANNKSYKMIMIDRPLLSLATRQIMTKNIASPRFTMISWHLPQPNRKSAITRVKPPTPLIDHDDCFKYLDFISQPLTLNLESDVRQLQSTYMILSDFLEDAADKIRNLVNIYVPKFSKQLESKARMKFEGIISEAVCLSVENYVLYLMHGKLMASIHHRYDKEDGIFMQKLGLISAANLSICQLGAQEAFARFSLSEDAINHLNSLTYLQSPLAVISSISELIKILSKSLNYSVKRRYLMGDELPGGYNESIAICSDDLIATIVYSLIKIKPSGLFSLSKYLELFGWDACAKDQAAYHTATFQIGIQYVFNYSLTDIDTPEKQAVIGRPDIQPTYLTNPQKSVNHQLSFSPQT